MEKPVVGVSGHYLLRSTWLVGGRRAVPDMDQRALGSAGAVFGAVYLTYSACP